MKCNFYDFHDIFHGERRKNMRESSSIILLVRAVFSQLGCFPCVRVFISKATRDGTLLWFQSKWYPRTEILGKKKHDVLLHPVSFQGIWEKVNRYVLSAADCGLECVIQLRHMFFLVDYSPWVSEKYCVQLFMSNLFRYRWHHLRRFRDFPALHAKNVSCFLMISHRKIN